MTTTVLPTPRDADPLLAPKLRWGIVAPGWIAGRFTTTVHAHTGQRVVAVGSRSVERGEAFAREHGVDRVHPSYEQLVEDPDVDVVYVASPHSHHREQALLAIAAGKHVLVEKAFTRNAAEAREVVAAARAAGVLLMEAMWSRYLPHADVVRRLLEDGAVGDVRLVTGDYGVRTDPPAGHRLLDPALAGGVLLDLGIYPLSFASFVARHAGLGAPTAVHAAGLLAPTGVDAQATVLLDHSGGAQAQVFTSMLTETSRTGSVAGSAGRIELGPDFYAPASVTLVADGRRLVWDEDPLRGHDGLCYQAAALARYVGEGRTESPWQPLDETVAVLETADEVRRQLGVVLPGE
ncbi:Gfo/Idh/MocA family protein [Cellulomonas sp. P22]|uniref:Gfo/Idh/MocA family protein n=1 Tax=Cellulomonas sp. P22 TaxID=3373189 RepID=UPI00379B60DF